MAGRPEWFRSHKAPGQPSIEFRRIQCPRKIIRHPQIHKVVIPRWVGLGFDAVGVLRLVTPGENENEAHTNVIAASIDHIKRVERFAPLRQWTFVTFRMQTLLMAVRGRELTEA